jgi:hypothetical protein
MLSQADLEKELLAWYLGVSQGHPPYCPLLIVSQSKYIDNSNWSMLT